ncbi:MAG: segregation/condensation protein A, partial [Parcubacteria group bacterium]|nr:segregation/condensation protein A [Parcubacteria group bacterium]
TASLEAFLKPFEERLIARTVSIEEKIQEVLVRVEKKAKMQLEEFARGGKKVDIILAFLALLFLFKEKVVTLVQSKRFGDIAVTKVGGEVSS